MSKKFNDHDIAPKTQWKILSCFLNGKKIPSIEGK